jgi:hypothetical protein
MKLLISLLALMTISTNAFAVDMKEVEKELTTSGVEGWVHGSVETQGLYVFTYRNPTNFFDYVQMSLVSLTPAMMKELGTYSRQDKVRVKGSFLTNPSPQKHILVSSIEMITKYQSPYPSAPYQHQAVIPGDLLNLTTATFLIHAIAGDGHILVVEYKDSILPIFVQNATLTKSLFRGDVVQLKFSIQSYPNQPVHLNLNEKDPQPLQVLESIQAKHGKPAVVEGALIMFPKSPEIMFNVFAVQEELQAGLKRQYTLVNFDDADLFQKIRDTLQKAWDQYPGGYVNARNKLVSTHIRVKATGVFNEVDPSQANPQILLNSIDSIQVIAN